MYIYIYIQKRVTGLRYLLVVRRPSQQMKNIRTLFESKLCSIPRLTRLSLLASGDLTSLFALLSVSRSSYLYNQLENEGRASLPILLDYILIYLYIKAIRIAICARPMQHGFKMKRTNGPAVDAVKDSLQMELQQSQGSIIQPLSMTGYTIDWNHSSRNLNPNGVGGQGHPLL